MTWDFLASSYDVVADTYATTFDDELLGRPVRFAATNRICIEASA